MYGRFRYWRHIFELYVELVFSKICGGGRDQSVPVIDVCEPEGFLDSLVHVCNGVKHFTQPYLTINPVCRSVFVGKYSTHEKYFPIFKCFSFSTWNRGI